MILLTIPAFIGHTRLYGLDLPLGSIFILTIALLILVKNKTNIKRLLLLGIIMSIGVLIRPQYLLYISVPFATVMIMIFIDNGLKKTLGVLLSVSLCVLSFICWLTESIDKVYKAYNELLVHIARDYYYKDIIFPYETGLSSFSIDWFFYYPQVFFINFGIFNSAILFISLILVTRSFVKKRNIHSNISLLIISSLWLYIVFTFMSSKVPRYLFPVYPLAAIISGCGISLYANKTLKNVVVIMLVFSLSFSVLMSHNESFEIAIEDFLYNKMKPASEVWLSIPRGEKGIEVVKSVSDILIRYSSKKPYPSVNISTNYSSKEMEFPIQVFYGNFVV